MSQPAKSHESRLSVGGQGFLASDLPGLIGAMAYLQDCYGDMELNDPVVGLQLTVTNNDGGEGRASLFDTQSECSPASSSSTDDVIRPNKLNN